MSNSIALSLDALGTVMLLTRTIPRFLFKEGHKTDIISGYRYDLVLPEFGYTQVSVNIPGEQQITMPDDGTYPAVELCGALEVYAYARDGRGELGLRAKGIRLTKG